MSPAPSWCTCGSQTHTAAVLLILQLICLEDLCASRAYISWQNAILCASQWLGCIIGSQALLVFLLKKKVLLVLWSTCWSEDVVHLAFAPVAILSNVELNAPSECHLLVHQSRHYLVDARDMDMRNLCWCFLRRSQSSSQELTCAHLTWGWTRFLASPWFFKDAWTKSGGNIEICRENLLLLRFWKLNRPVLGLIILMTIERQKNDKFWGWCYWCVE